MTPIEVWEPFHTYQGDCCGLFADFFDIIWKFEDQSGCYSRNELYRAFLKLVVDYPDVPDPKATFDELVEIQVELGPISRMIGIVA